MKTIAHLFIILLAAVAVAGAIFPVVNNTSIAATPSDHLGPLSALSNNGGQAANAGQAFLPMAGAPGIWQGP